ncbi:2-amino-4-hydroxy-6-hydroxymethyldihydropteridine diphosphokinase [Streptomyces sp. NPDC055709]
MYDSHSDPTVRSTTNGSAPEGDAAVATLPSPRKAVLALSANLGNRIDALQGAVDALGDTPGLQVQDVSPLCEADHGSRPPSLNAVVVVETHLPAGALLERGQAIEEAFNGHHDQRPVPRTIDIALVTYAGLDHEGLVLTLPQAHERARVLAPWYCLDPAARLPGHGPIEDLLAVVGTAGVAPRPELRLVLPD